jgi:hypothetical protein
MPPGRRRYEEWLSLYFANLTKYATERPGGPKEFSPGRQPWVQKALVSGSPSGAKEKASTPELSLVVPPLQGLDWRLGLVSRGWEGVKKSRCGTAS